MLWIVLAVGLLCFSAGAIAGSGGAPAPRPHGVGGSWHLIFDDNFDGSRLDGSWTTGWFGSGVTGGVNSDELECYDPRQVAESRGTLSLTLVDREERCDGRARPYTSGIVTTNGRFAYTYGFVEVRAWLPTRAGQIADWPAIWEDGPNWPLTGEIDILEGRHGDACWHIHDTSGAPGGCAAGIYTGGWHTFGANWEPGRVTFYYDGRRVGVLKQRFRSAPMYLILGLGSWPGTTVAAPATLRVKYVRVWQH